MNQHTKLDKFFSEYLKQRSSEGKEKTLDYFINFNSNEDLESFLKDYGITDKDTENSDKNLGKSSPFDVHYKFSILPTLFIRSSLEFLESISNNDRLKSIEGNYRVYLSSNQINGYDIITHSDIVQNSFYKPRGKGVKIAIFDSGIDNNHPDLLNKVKNQFDLTLEEKKGNSTDLVGHGTMLAGIIAGSGIGSDGIFKGIAPASELIDVKIMDKSGIAFISDILLGLEAIKNESLDIILFGANAAIPSDGYDVLSRACKIFCEQGVILISPVGNFGPDQGSIGTPAFSDYVFSLGSTDNDQNVAFFSSRGFSEQKKIKPDLVLPGVKIFATKSLSGILGTVYAENNLYCSTSGTSASAAIFTGMVALIKELNPKLNSFALKNVLRSSSNSLFLSGISQGNGIPDLAKIFENLNISMQKPVQYKSIAKKSFIFSVEIVIFFVIIFYIANYFLSFI